MLSLGSVEELLPISVEARFGLTEPFVREGDINRTVSDLFSSTDVALVVNDKWTHLQNPDENLKKISSEIVQESKWTKNFKTIL